MGIPQAKTAKALPPPSCGGCRCFIAPTDKPGADPVHLAASGGDKGECIRFPQPVRKRPGEYCFEFVPKEAQPNAR